MENIYDILSMSIMSLKHTTLVYGVLPQDWKVANVILVYEKGDHHHPGNIGPSVSHPQCINYLILLLKTTFVSHMMKINLFSKEQHGFLPKLVIHT